MLYTVNAKLLGMIQNSKWMPSDVSALEKLLNTKIIGININTMLIAISSWFSEVNEKSKDNDEILIPTNKDIILILRYLLQYYKTLLKCSNEIIDINKTKKNPKLKDVTAISEVNEIIECLQKYEDMYFKDNFGTNPKELFKALTQYFYPVCNKIWEISLKNELSQKQIKELYIQFLNCGISLYDLINSISDAMFTLYSDKWISNTLNGKKLNMTYSKFKIDQPQNVIVSFCVDTSKYTSSSQDIISASLFNTKDLVSDNKDDRAFHDRSLGFMYNFSQDIILGMNTEDTYSYNTDLNSYLEMLGALFQGVALCYNLCAPHEKAPVHTLAKAIQMSSLGLKPIYDFSEFQEKTVIYNEIVLSSAAKPYGIFVFREKMYEVLPEVFSLVITMQLPLFICNHDGSLDCIPCNKIFEIVRDKFKPLDP